MASSYSLTVLAIALIALILPIYGQVNTSCSPTMISSFTPCMNFITNSTANATMPSAACCNSLKTMTSSSTDCLCLIVTGSVPFQIPINRTLAISLPRACNMPGVPLNCNKVSVSPVPAPGPAALAPSAISPTGSSVPEAESPSTNALTPESDATPSLTPPSTVTPTTNPGSKPVVNPSAANPTYSLSPLFLLAVLGATLLKYYY